MSYGDFEEPVARRLRTMWIATKAAAPPPSPTSQRRRLSRYRSRTTSSAGWSVVFRMSMLRGVPGVAGPDTTTCWRPPSEPASWPVARQVDRSARLKSPPTTTGPAIAGTTTANRYRHCARAISGFALTRWVVHAVKPAAGAHSQARPSGLPGDWYG